MTTPPRDERHNPTLGAEPAPALVTWCAWRGTAGPPPVLGRTSEDAEKRLLEHLAHFYAREAEAPVEHPRVRAREESRRYKNLGLACHCAPNEAASFVLCVETCMLSPDEALVRWRAVFPTSEAGEPLADLVRNLARERVGETRRLPEALQDRIRVLGRFLDKLPRLSAPRMDDLRTELEGPTT